MADKLYEKRIQVRAMQFEGYPSSDPMHIYDVNMFVQIPTSLSFTTTGIVLRIIFSEMNVLEVRVGEYIVKDATGKITKMTKAAFEAEYTEVTE
ncbi:hypothetical protein M3629_03795 [Paenibacillus polysaccharolyticus]|uniref:hypothetical protein n=1 Tax=Paenibacillus polysaccharolyticus TaxID=582692 RepID=UPI002041D852|nr:hypothetical protein [Paenibacillus polysaccharolyticus]MCM3131891.1 hypothetical protein [Paenibacillus polysaccharolyticus]